jgi:hypothetical protein
MGDRKMNVDLVDAYSNDDYVIVHTDRGEFRCGKNSSKLLKQDENNKWVEISREENKDLIDNWIHYVKENHDKMSDTFEDLDYYRNKTNQDTSSIISSLRKE